MSSTLLTGQYVNKGKVIHDTLTGKGSRYMRSATGPSCHLMWQQPLSLYPPSFPHSQGVGYPSRGTSESPHVVSQSREPLFYATFSASNLAADGTARHSSF